MQVHTGAEAPSGGDERGEAARYATDATEAEAGGSASALQEAPQKRLPLGAAKPRTWLYVKRCVLDLLRTLFIPLVLFSAENIVCISVGPQSVLRNDPSTSCEDTGYEFTCVLSTLEYPFLWGKGVLNGY